MIDFQRIYEKISQKRKKNLKEKDIILEKNSMYLITYFILAAAILHILEEYVYPGGFQEFARNSVPVISNYVTTGFVVIVNGLFLLLCLGAILIVSRLPVYTLSVAALCGINGLLHAGNAFRTRKYVPGMLSGILLYLPLAVLAFYLFIHSGGVTSAQIVIAIILGILFQSIPPLVLLLTWLLSK